MSAVPTSSSFTDTLIQLIQQMMLTADITSAGGDSPKVNKILRTDVSSADFDEIIRNTIRDIVDEQTQGDSTLPTLDAGEEGGFTSSQGVGVARSALSKFQNPEGLVAEGLQFLPHAAVVSFALVLIPIIINELTKPGGPFDLRWKRQMEKEFNALMDRQTAYDLNIGERGLIVQTRQGFINNLGRAGNANTLRQIREGGVNRLHLNEIDYTDHAQGLF